MLSPTRPQHGLTSSEPVHPASERQMVTLQVNGIEHSLALEPRRTLLDALRHDLHLTGTKKVCDMGNCGACTVLVDGQAMYACLLLAVDCHDRAITTIEGLTNSGHSSDSNVNGRNTDSNYTNGNSAMGETEEASTLDPIQKAFIEADAFQCGFCTSGQIMSLKALLQSTPTPTDEQILRAVSGNLCRCGAYSNILKAGRLAANQQAANA